MPMQRVAIASWESIGTQIPLFCGWRGAAVSGARPRKAVNVLPDIVVVRLLDEVAHRHVFDHAPAQRADGLITHRGAPVLRWRLIDPSILKTERPPVTCARSKSYCGRRNRPTAPPAPSRGSGFVLWRKTHVGFEQTDRVPLRAQLCLPLIARFSKNETANVSFFLSQHICNTTIQSYR